MWFLEPPAAAMKRVLLSLFIPGALLAADDPRLSLWMTGNSMKYARVTETTTSAPVAVWPSPGIARNPQSPTQPIPGYADVQQVLFSNNFVYVRSSDLASHRMGPWYKEYAKLTVNGLWPQGHSLTSRIPRNPVAATTPEQVGQGPIGVLLNGVTIANFGDGSAYNTALGRDGQVTNGGIPGNQTQVWIRCATGAEGPILDSGYGHPAPDGGYHYHANPRALRFQLGDNLTYSLATDTYTEATGTLRHSPILGWAYDGYPIYGPYGYGTANDAKSPVRRIVSGFVPRDGSFGTTNLAATGRRSIAPWAALLHTFTPTLGTGDFALPSTAYGPNVSADFPIGWYAEDNDFLGDILKPGGNGAHYQQGVDFDLDKSNGRQCVTPEFPLGIYAYFLPIDAKAVPAYPFVIGRYWHGLSAGGRVPGNINESVTEFVRGGQASPITVTATNSGVSVAITWTSVEGGTYRIETSPDAKTWTSLAGAVTSIGGETTTFTTATIATNYRVTLIALAAYDTDGTGGLSGIGNSATAATAVVGASGTARLVNIATRAALGGVAGTPIPGFVLGGTGTKQMLVRAVGPTLSGFGVGGALVDPRLSLVSGSTTLGTNDNWLVTDTATMAGAGAFALTAGSRDAALVATLAPGAYTAPVTATDNGSGVALLEVYDASTAGTMSVVNASTRAFVGTGDLVLIPGFTISGPGTLRLLIRAVGPTLASFGLGGVLADPTITLYRGATALATNDNWFTADAAAMTTVGAFALPPGSKDAALVSTLAAGSYTAVVSGVGNTTGTALVELYVIP